MEDEMIGSINDPMMNGKKGQKPTIKLKGKCPKCENKLNLYFKGKKQYCSFCDYRIK